MIETGLEKFTVCQPDPVSPVNVADASSCPLADHRLPTSGQVTLPRICKTLTRASALDLAGAQA